MNLLETVRRVLVVLIYEKVSLNGWTDSTIALSWLSKPASSWQTFICNRISKIQSFLSFKNGIKLPVTKTRPIFAPVESLQTKLQTIHCGGTDHLGYTKNRLGHILKFLQLLFSQFKQTRLLFQIVNLAFVNNLAFLDFDRFNSFRKLVRVICYVLLFLKLIKTKQRAPSTAGVAKIHSASIKFLQLIQFCELQDETALLHSQNVLPESNFFAKSSLRLQILPLN